MPVCWCTKDTDKRLREGFSCHNAFYQSHHLADVRAGKCVSPGGLLRRTAKRNLPKEEEAAVALIETMPKIACVVPGVLLSAHKKAKLILPEKNHSALEHSIPFSHYFSTTFSPPHFIAEIILKTKCTSYTKEMI